MNKDYYGGKPVRMRNSSFPATWVTLKLELLIKSKGRRLKVIGLSQFIQPFFLSEFHAPQILIAILFFPSSYFITFGPLRAAERKDQ